MPVAAQQAAGRAIWVEQYLVSLSVDHLPCDWLLYFFLAVVAAGFGWAVVVAADDVRLASTTGTLGGTRPYFSTGPCIT